MNPNTSDDIWVIGAGAIGMLLAAKLQQTGSRTTVWCRTREQAEHIQTAGICIEEDHKVDTVYPGVSVLHTELPFSGQPARPAAVLLCVKQTAIRHELIQAIRERIEPEVPLICFQNGMGHIESLQVVFQQVWPAITTEAALKTGSNQVRHTGRGVTRVGSLSLKEDGDPVDPGMLNTVISCMEKAGFVVQMSKNMKTEMWRKLAINALINPLTALFRIRNGQLLGNTHLEGIMQQLLEEIRRAAACEDVTAGMPEWEDIVQVCRSTADNQSSMLQDVMHHRPTELRWITGYVLDTAGRHQLRLEKNEQLFELVLALEAVYMTS
ncbi:ketopantoate reductase family protein [Marinicrinis sediminis]|uniref:2-dehydropantoate 2-reductase n=1 Tax=Marinicrinis sediminis TaxID=1652465 RepID=A0ABW5RC68_9BACL